MTAPDVSQRSRDLHHPTEGCRLALSVAAWLTAVSAYAGAVGLATGWLALGRDLDARLPFESPVFGAVALALFVGVPFTVLARYAECGDDRTDMVAFSAGMTLILWIVVELAFIRELSFFHPAYVAVGIAFAVAGLRERQR